MNQEKVIELINKAGDNVFFVGKLDLDKIQQIEKELDVTLPESYKWFLKEYGLGGVASVEIIGGGLSKVPSCITETKQNRRYNLPINYVVIENCDEWVYCLDTSRMFGGECPVVDWCNYDSKQYREYKDFYEFLVDRFSGALENLD